MKKTVTLKEKALQFAAKTLRNSAEVAAGSQSHFFTYEPKIPAALKKASH